MNFVSIDWTLIFTWGNLLILFLLMKKFLFKPVRKIMEERQKEIDDSYADIEEKKKQAESMKEEYEDKLSKAGVTAENIIKEASKKATEKEEAILKDATIKASEIIKRADNEAELSRKSALNSAKDEISKMAVSIAEKVLEKDIDENEHKDLIDKFIDEIGDME